MDGSAFAQWRSRAWTPDQPAERRIAIHRRTSIDSSPAPEERPLGWRARQGSRCWAVRMKECCSCSSEHYSWVCFWLQANWPRVVAAAAPAGGRCSGAAVAIRAAARLIRRAAPVLNPVVVRPRLWATTASLRWHRPCPNRCPWPAAEIPEDDYPRIPQISQIWISIWI